MKVSLILKHTCGKLKNREFFQRCIQKCVKHRSFSPVDTGRKLNVHKTFRRRPGRLMNALCTFNLPPVYGVAKFVSGLAFNRVFNTRLYFRVWNSTFKVNSRNIRIKSVKRIRARQTKITGGIEMEHWPKMGLYQSNFYNLVFISQTKSCYNHNIFKIRSNISRWKSSLSFCTC